MRGKFRRYVSFGDVVGYVTWLHEMAVRGEVVRGDVPSYTADPDDDYLVALALSSGASYLVSGDRHLLDLGAVTEPAPEGPERGVNVFTPREFLVLLGAEE
jgi:predicted nucleic acid-binding protein